MAQKDIFGQNSFDKTNQAGQTTPLNWLTKPQSPEEIRADIVTKLRATEQAIRDARASKNGAKLLPSLLQRQSDLTLQLKNPAKYYFQTKEKPILQKRMQYLQQATPEEQGLEALPAFLTGNTTPQKTVKDFQTAFQKWGSSVADTLNSYTWTRNLSPAISEIQKGLLNPANITQGFVDWSTNPAEQMDKSLYGIVNPKNTPAQKAEAAVNSAMIVLTLTPMLGGVAKAVTKSTENAAAKMGTGLIKYAAENGVDFPTIINKLNVTPKFKEQAKNVVEKTIKQPIKTYVEKKTTAPTLEELANKSKQGAIGKPTMPLTLETTPVKFNFSKMINTGNTAASKLFKDFQENVASGLSLTGDSKLMKIANEYFLGDLITRTKKITDVIPDVSIYRRGDDIFKYEKAYEELLYLKNGVKKANINQDYKRDIISKIDQGLQQLETVHWESKGFKKGIEDQGYGLSASLFGITPEMLSAAGKFFGSDAIKKIGMFIKSGTTGDAKIMNNLLNDTSTIKPIFEIMEDKKNTAAHEIIQRLLSTYINKNIDVSNAGELIMKSNDLRRAFISKINAKVIGKTTEPVTENNYKNYLTSKNVSKFFASLDKQDVATIIGNYSTAVKDAFINDELRNVNGRFYLFPKDLQESLLQDISNLNNPSLKNYMLKYFSAPTFKSEANVVGARIPSAVASLTERSERLASNVKKLKTQFDISFNEFKKNITPNAHDNQYQLFQQMIKEVPIKDIPAFMSANNFDKNFLKLGEFFTENKYKNSDKTIFQIASETAGETTSKVYSISRYTQNPKVAPDPLAFYQHFWNLVNRAKTAQPLVDTRKILSNFITESIPKDATAKQKQVINAAASAMKSTEKQLLGYAPTIDAELNRLSSNFLSKLSAFGKVTGASQIAANVSSAISQTIPITFNIAAHGGLNTIEAIGRALTYGRNPVFKESLFLTNRFAEDNNAVYNALKKQYLKNVGIRGLYQNARNILGEKGIDTFTRYTMGSVDRLMSNIVFHSAYSKALDNLKVAGVKGTEEELRKRAIKIADDATSKLMADRSPGGLPEIFSTELGKTMFQFGLEAVNQPGIVGRFFKGSNVAEKSANFALSLAKWGVASWVYNNIIEHATGRRPALDIVGTIDDFMKQKQGVAESPITQSMKNVPVLSSLPGRVPSAPQAYQIDPVKIISNISGISGFDFSTTPTASLINGIITKFKDYSPEKIVEMEPEQRKAAIKDLVMSNLAALVKGGNQAYKTYKGTVALLNEYYDPRQIKTGKQKPFGMMTQEQLQSWVQSEQSRRLKEILSKKEATIKGKDLDLVQKGIALLFSPKATSVARTKAVEKYQFEQEIKRLKQIKQQNPITSEIVNPAIKATQEARKAKLLNQ